MKRIVSIVFNTFLVLLILLCGGLLVDKYINSSMIPSAFGITPLKVLTGSMEPAISPGDLVIAKKTNINDIENGDVISFYEDKNMDYIITHRVTKIINNELGRELITKGDANNLVDKTSINEEMLIGKVIVNIPFLGAMHTIMGSNFTVSIVCIVTGALLFINATKKHKIKRSIYKESN